MENTTKMSVNMSAKDVFNAKRASLPIDEIIGKPIKVKGFALADTTDKETGEVRQVGYVVSDEGLVYGFVSDICREGIADLIDMYEEDNSILNGLEIVFMKSISKSGRNFNYIHIR